MLSPKSTAILQACCLQGSLPASADELFASADHAPDQQDLKDMVRTLLAELADSQASTLQLQKQVRKLNGELRTCRVQHNDQIIALQMQHAKQLQAADLSACPAVPPLEPAAAAVRIQALYRGRKTRKKLRAWMQRCGLRMPAVVAPVQADRAAASSHQPWSGSRNNSSIGAVSVAAAVAAAAGPTRRAPRMVCCYVCGTQHGLASLLIHQKQCITNRAKVQATLAPKDRKPMPPAPSIPPPCHEHSTLAQVDAYNAQVTAIYETLMPLCGNCGRRFKDEGRLAKHSVGCKAGHFKPLSRSPGTKPATSSVP